MHQLIGVDQLTPERRFAELLADDATRPFVTYYDEATGERSELSRKSLANWVAKTRNLLGDELGLGVGDTAALALPAHWLTVPIALGVLTAGLTVAGGGSVDVGFGVPDRASELDAADTYLIDPARAAVGFGDDVPAGASDYVLAVRPQGDAWAAVSMPATAADVAYGEVGRADAMAAAAQLAGEVGLGEGGRLLVTGDTDWQSLVLVPLAVGGSVVVVRGDGTVPADVLDRRAEQERVTARL